MPRSTNANDWLSIYQPSFVNVPPTSDPFHSCHYTAGLFRLFFISVSIAMTFQAPAFNHYTPSYYTANSGFPCSSDSSQILGSSQNTKTTPESYIQTSEVVILEPTSFSEVPSAVHILRNNQVVVLNLANMAKEEAQRSVDFIAGGAYMYQGSLEKIDINIFLFTPRNTNIRVENHADQGMVPSAQEAKAQAPKAHFSSPVSHSFLVHQAS